MTAQADALVFWPGIHYHHQSLMGDVQPLQLHGPFPTSPAYPFQCICADFFHYKETNYLVIVDLFSNWPIVK